MSGTTATAGATSTTSRTSSPASTTSAPTTRPPTSAPPSSSTTPTPTTTTTTPSTHHSSTSASTSLVVVASNAVVASDCTLEGRVTIGEGSVLHPRCRIVAGPGCSVTIGRYNIVEELAVISAGAGGGSGGGDQKESVVLVIGDNNLFEVGCVVKASKIGDRNVIESRAVLNEKSEVGNDCVIGPRVVLGAGEKVRDSNVIVAPNNASRVATDAREAHMAVHTRHLQILHATLPKYHRLTKSAGAGK